MHTVILDIDETLVYSRQEVLGSIKFTAPGDEYESYTIARPSAKEFLELLSKKYKIIALTSGVLFFQKAVLESLDFLKYFEELYGYTTIDRSKFNIPKFEKEHKWVLVDNLSEKGMDLGDKRFWLGGTLDRNSNFIQCISFWGGSFDPQPLTDLLPRIDELLST